MFKDKNYLYIVLACLFTYACYLLLEFYFTGGQLGVPLDDTWIHFQFADNFSKGYFYQYNPGEPAAGTTSPLYVIILGLFNLSVNNFIISSVFLSAVFHLLSCIFIYKISLLIFKNEYSLFRNFPNKNYSPEFLSLLTALLTAFTGRFTWASLSGMETTMFTFFCAAGIYFHLVNLQKKRINLLPAVFISLAAVSRPEGYLLCMLYIFDLTSNLIKDRTLRMNCFKIFFTILIILLITLPYLIFSYEVSGSIFPNTYKGQGGRINFIPDFNYLRIAGIYFFRDNIITATLFLASIIFYLLNLKKYFKNLRLINLILQWCILLPLAFSILIPNWRHHVRYLIPLIPFINFIAVYILASLPGIKYLRNIKNYIPQKPRSLSIIILFSMIYFIVYGFALGKNTDNINSQQVKLAKWVKENIPQKEVIALNDIGAITFIGKNRIIDMMGLITPEILQFRNYDLSDNLDSMNSLLKENNVSYIIIYDEWFKEFMKKYGGNFTFVTSAYLENNTICGGNEMKVYKTNYNKTR